jgi:transposase
MRIAMVSKQTGCKNQIKGLLDFYGIKIPEELSNSHWSNRFVCWLESLKESHREGHSKEGLSFEYYSGQQTLGVLLSELRYLRSAIAQLTKDIRHLSGQKPYSDFAGYLTSVPGISTTTAMVFLTELDDITRFKNLDHLASYVGLIPGEDSSGDKQQHTGVSKRRNANLRYLLIESSWVAVRKDPALLKTYTELTKRMPKNLAIIRIARKLLNRIQYVLKNQCYYESGVVS